MSNKSEKEPKAADVEKKEVKRLYKSQSDRMLAGICGGIAEYFNLDAAVVRIIFVLLALFGGSGVIAYIAGIFVIPDGEPIESTKSAKSAKTEKPRPSNPSVFWGGLLVVLGVIFLIFENSTFPFHFAWFRHDFFDIILPLAILAMGVWMLMQHDSKSADSADDTSDNENRLRRSRTERKIGGVCGGISEHFNIDPTIIRILWILVTFASFGFGFLAYVILLIAIPEEDVTINTEG